MLTEYQSRDATALKKTAFIKHSLMTLALITLSWAGVLHGSVIAICTPLILGVAFALLRRTWLPVAVVFVNPLIISSGQGVTSWFGSAPNYKTTDSPGYESFNLDRSSRCYRRSDDHATNGGGWMWPTFQNSGLGLMNRMFGVPPHTYHGVYPTQEEATRLTEKCAETPFVAFLGDTVIANNVTISLAPKTCESFIADCGGIYVRPEPTYRVRASLLEGQCLLVRLSPLEDENGAKDADVPDVIALFDASTKRAFARYVVSGSPALVPKIMAD